MPQPFDPQLEQLIEAYLDGALSSTERDAFDQRLASDSELRGVIALQRQMDQSLRVQFRGSESRPVPPLPPDTTMPKSSDVSPLKHDPRPTWALRAPLRRRVGLLLAVTASLACLLFSWNWIQRPTLVPVFVARPLAEIYEAAVAQGFEPYYECRDAQRFSETFLRRQGQPLRLAQLPPDRRMLGLSYPGGLSRETTAMLGQVEGKPVMIFIDRREFDRDAVGSHNTAGLRIFRQELGPLVMYEVTPHLQPGLLKYLTLDGKPSS